MPPLSTSRSPTLALPLRATATRAWVGSGDASNDGGGGGGGDGDGGGGGGGMQTWRRLVSAVPLAHILPKDPHFGVGVAGRPDNSEAEHLAWYGDKILDRAISRARA